MKQYRINCQSSHNVAARLVFAALGAALVAAGCTSFPGLRPVTYASPGEARIFASPGKCPHEPVGGPEAGAVITAILTGVASQLLTNFGTALNEGAKGGALPSSIATLNLSLPPDAVPGCIIIVRGAFERDDRNRSRIDVAKALNLDGTNLTIKKRIDDLYFPDLYRVDHLIELQIVRSPNNKALSFAPIFVSLARSMDEAKEGERDLSISLKFKAGEKESGSVVLVPDRLIGAVPTVLSPHASTKRFPREAPWFATFHTTAAPSSTDAKTPPAPPVTLTDVFSSDSTAVPVTVTATVVETRPTREGLAFIASVFTSIKPKLDEALKPIIDTKFKEAEDVKQATAELTGDAEHEAKVTAAKLAVLQYCFNASKEANAAGEIDRLTKSSAARVAQLNANASAIKYGKSPLPYAKYIEVSPSTVPAECPPV